MQQFVVAFILSKNYQYTTRTERSMKTCLLFYRQNEGTAPARPSSAGELPPLERTGSPTGAEKDILVKLHHNSLF